jgi:endonuclease/exonuclease/phosphatase family metal-dependent hydrolase
MRRPLIGIRALVVAAALVGAPLAVAAAGSPARTAVPAPAAQDGLRVLTWNVQGGTAGDGREPDIFKLAQVLAETLPDVVGLQEICRQTIWQEEAIELLASMGYSRPVHARGVGARVRPHDGGPKFGCSYGTALFVRGRVDEERRRELFPRDANGRRPERRKVACVRTTIGRAFWFCNTHVARKEDRDRRGDRITQRQIASLARQMRRLDGPVVLVGDLNRKPQRDSPLAEQFDEIDPENQPTLGDDKIDYILYTPEHFRRGDVSFLDPAIVDTDHRGMLGTLAGG